MLDARVTLAGLWADKWPGGHSPLWPWAALHTAAANQYVHWYEPRDNQGRALLHEDKLVVLRISAGRARSAARRLRQRALLAAWRNRTLHIAAELPPRKAEAWFMVGAAAVGAGAMLVPAFMTVPKLARMPTGSPDFPLAVIAALFMGIMVLGMPGVLLWLAISQLRRGRCTRIELDTQALSGRHPDKGEFHIPWAQVRAIKPDLTGRAVRVELNTGERQWIGPLDQRMQTAIRIVRTELLGARRDSEARQVRRLCWVCLLGGAAATVVAVILHHLLLPDEPRETMRIGFSLGAVLAALTLLLALVSNERLARRLRRRLTRRSRQSRG